MEFVPSVIKKVEKKKLYPQIPKIKAKKISVNEIGNPIKITNNIAAHHDQTNSWFIKDGLRFHHFSESTPRLELNQVRKLPIQAK